MQIVPMKDLKDTTRIETMCAESQAPVFVTKNGYGRLVVMDISCYEKIMNQAYEARIINEGLKDVENGRVKEGNAVLHALETKYGF